MAEHDAGFSSIDGGVVAAEGFLCAGVHCGLKKSGRPDLALVVAHETVPAAAVFTRNRLAAAPVELSRIHIEDGRARAVVINSGNANACTGARGMEDAISVANAVAERLGCASSDVIVCSTGVIGVPLPVDKIITGIDEAVESLDSRSGTRAAEAIMTTDTFAKECAVSLELGGRRIRIGGMAKGSGMIKPDMATMLAVLTTDAPLTSEACAEALRSACATTFNRLTVDGDTSTNDTVVLLASGAAGGPRIATASHELERFIGGLRAVSTELARMIARDGEGATKLVTVTVTGAASEADAERAAFSIAESPLVKTALFGNDANWGRIAMAVGKSGADLDPARLSISVAGIEVFGDGEARGFDEERASRALDAPEVEVLVDLGCGTERATVLTCDLSYDYVRINAAYRT